MNKLWHRLFLEERPSISLAFFRLAMAITVGAHVIPTLCHLHENYFSTAFKTYNFNFFTASIIELVQRSPDGLVLFFAFFFFVVWFLFLIGLWTQLNAILMLLGCYYFYALNSFQVGTLSWDILLVTLFLMCVTPYPSDYFSVDCLLRGDPDAYKRPRPYFLQRLLQMQVAFTFLYTGLYKITPPQGNWLRDNPIYYLVNYPYEGVTKTFLLKDWMATHPHFCYVVGVMIVMTEILFPILLFWPRTRRSAIVLGFFFHLLLILTLDVPAIFFFLFPAQLLLFIDPKKIIAWVERKQNISAACAQSILVYDGGCGFCRRSVQILQVMDMFKTLKYVDYNQYSNLSELHPQLTPQIVASQIHLIEPDGHLRGGFFVFRPLCFKMPMMFLLTPLFYFPASGLLGPMVYRWVAKNRYLLHFSRACQNNQCFIKK